MGNDHNHPQRFPRGTTAIGCLDFVALHASKCGQGTLYQRFLRGIGELQNPLSTALHNRRFSPSLCPRCRKFLVCYTFARASHSLLGLLRPAFLRTRLHSDEAPRLACHASPSSLPLSLQAEPTTRSKSSTNLTRSFNFDLSTTTALEFLDQQTYELPVLTWDSRHVPTTYTDDEPPPPPLRSVPGNPAPCILEDCHKGRLHFGSAVRRLQERDKTEVLRHRHQATPGRQHSRCASPFENNSRS